MKRRKRWTEGEETSYWSSYSDMMAALLLIFVLIISVTMMQAKKQLEEKEKEVATQKELLDEQSRKMDEQEEELERLLGVRGSVIEGLKNEFNGSDLSVYVEPQTGSITFDSTILFSVDKDTLKPEGKEFLKIFLPRYLKVLLSKEFKPYLAEIIIEGHTDTDGPYLSNLELSQQRALSVATYCLDENSNVLKPKQIDKLKKIITCNGRSFSNPIYKANGKVDKKASRRVEFKFRLKDEEMIEQTINILSDNGR